MVSMDVVYQGNLRCEATHGPSGNTVLTDAPVDNCGRGETFSPTDLVGTALASCVLTIMGIVADRNGIDLTGTTAHVDKAMSADLPRRIVALPVTVTVPRPLSDDDRSKLENAAKHCPVHKSLREDIEAPITFVYSA